MEIFYFKLYRKRLSIFYIFPFLPPNYMICTQLRRKRYIEKGLFIFYAVTKPSKPLIRVKLLKFFGKTFGSSK